MRSLNILIALLLEFFSIHLCHLFNSSIFMTNNSINKIYSKQNVYKVRIHLSFEFMSHVVIHTVLHVPLLIVGGGVYFWYIYIYILCINIHPHFAVFIWRVENKKWVRKWNEYQFHYFDDFPLSLISTFISTMRVRCTCFSYVICIVFHSHFSLLIHTQTRYRFSAHLFQNAWCADGIITWILYKVGRYNDIAKLLSLLFWNEHDQI